MLKDIMDGEWRIVEYSFAFPPNLEHDKHDTIY